MNPFEGYAAKYDVWFDENDEIFRCEVDAVKRFFEKNKSTVEIGVGTGRFAEKLGIEIGVEPVDDMARFAKKRGVKKIIKCDAQNLSLPNECYEQVVMITLDCFVDDFGKAVGEAYRILKKSGNLVVAFLNKATPLGKVYDENKARNSVYCCAAFHTHYDILKILESCGFRAEGCCSCVESLDNIYGGVEDGFGEGIFTVIGAKK